MTSSESPKRISSVQISPPIKTHSLKLGLKTCLHAPTLSEECCSLEDSIGNLSHEINLIDAADNVEACSLKLIISRCPFNSEVDPEIKELLRIAVLDWIRAVPSTREGIESLIDDLVSAVIRLPSTVSDLSQSTNSFNLGKLSYSGLNETSNLSASSLTLPQTVPQMTSQVTLQTASSAVKTRKIPNLYIK
jgi:DNA-binding transcriptional ArsR family regulator